MAIGASWNKRETHDREQFGAARRLGAGTPTVGDVSPFSAAAARPTPFFLGGEYDLGALREFAAWRRIGLQARPGCGVCFAGHLAAAVGANEVPAEARRAGLRAALLPPCSRVFCR